MKFLRDLSPYVCRPELPLREAMVRLGQVDPLFQLVVDEDERLIGTITDGDIRRALLRGVGLDASARDAMNANPIVGRFGQDVENRRRLDAIRGLVVFLPVVDEDRRLRHVVIASIDDVELGPVLVMAGGRGTRLGKITSTLPKPLVPVAGRPMLDRVLEHLEAAGYRDVFISVHYMSEAIADFVASRSNSARITLLHERMPLGTAGAISLLPPPGTRPFLVINADVLTRVDLSALQAFHARQQAAATICVREYNVAVPFGVVRCSNAEQFLGIEEKPTIRNFVSAGIYYLSPMFHALVPAGTPMDMPTLLNSAHGHGLKVSVFPVHEYWIDVGRPADLATADSDMTIEHLIGSDPSTRAAP